jgi:2-methylcitrate dehydratase PrpD
MIDAPCVVADDDATRRIAEFAVSFPATQLPPDIVQKARTQLLDGIAVALAAVDAEGIPALRAAAAEWAGAPQAGIMGSALRVPAPTAALVNGAMMHALDFDDTHAAAYIHPGTVIIPSALAAAERAGNISGTDLLGAIAINSEVMTRMGLAFPGSSKSTCGWHFTPLLGHLAAALTAARIAKLSVDRAIDALGIAYHQAAGNMQGLVDGGLTKRVGPGFAAQHGLIAMVLAEAGVTGAKCPLEGRFGLFRQYGGADGDRSVLLDALGTRFESRDIFVKPYPCCALVHPFIDAALTIARSTPIAVEEIAAIHIRCGRGTDLVCQPATSKQRPRNIVDAQFSAYWGVAAALARGSVSTDAYTVQALQAADLRHLSAMVVTEVDPCLSRSRGIDPTELTLTMRDGRQLCSLNYKAQDEAPRPFDVAVNKLRGLPAAADIIEAIATLEYQPNLTRLTSALFRTASNPVGSLPGR